MTKISIIMPLFNAERYLPEALNSVLKQTYGDFELICIDDCSTDGTRIVIEELKKKDARIRLLVNEKNSGAAISRNKGLEAANGEYVLFLDGDDIFEEEMLEKVSGTMEKYHADIVLFEYMHMPSETIYTKQVIERPEGFRENYCKAVFSMDDFEPREFLRWPDSPCNRMFRRNFIEKKELKFQDLPSCNDVYFANMSLFCAERIICLDDRRVMVYARDHSEPSRISNHRNPMCAYYAMEKLCIELKKRGMIEKYAPYVYRRLVECFMYLLEIEKNEELKKSFYIFLHTEGISKCIEYGKEYYGQIDEYDKYLLESFQNNPYESGWFDNPDTYFQVWLKKYGFAIREFIKSKILKNEKMVLWGVGRNGKSLLKYLTEHSIRIWGAVDCDQAKQGTIISGYEIKNPIAIGNEVDYVLVTSNQLYQEVSNILKETEIVIVDLLEFLVKNKADLENINNDSRENN